MACTSAGDWSTNRSLCNTSSTAWRSVVPNARGDGARGRVGVERGAGRRRHLFSQEYQELAKGFKENCELSQEVQALAAQQRAHLTGLLQASSLRMRSR